jgi:hypothetical protein
MLELAAESGCAMLSIGFESVSRETLKSVHKHVNRPEKFVRANKAKGSVKTRRKCAGWDPKFLLEILQLK